MASKKVASRRDRSAQPASEQRPGSKRVVELIRAHHMVILAVLVALGSYAYTLDEKLDLNGDNVKYYLLGRSLATGQGYSELWQSGQPTHYSYPPVYPLLIALAIVVFGMENFLAVKWMNGLFFLLCVVLVYRLSCFWTRQKALAAAMALAIAFNANLLAFGSMMMTEIPFVFFTLLGLWFAGKIPEHTENPVIDRHFLATMVCFGLAYYTRTAGLACLFGITVYFAIRRRWSYLAAAVGGSMLIMLPWSIWGRRGQGSSYLRLLLLRDPYAPEAGTIGPWGLLERLYSNLFRYIHTEIPEAFFPGWFGPHNDLRVLGWIVGIGIFTVASYGLWKLPRFNLLLLSYLAGTFGMILVWPEVWYGIRFVLPVVPLLLILFYHGLVVAVSTSIRRPGFPSGFFPLLCGALIFASNAGAVHRRHQYARAPYPAAWANYFSLAAWARENTPEDAVIACRKPEFFYLFSNRPCVLYAFDPDQRAVIAQMKADDVRYVILAPLGFGTTSLYLVPALRAHQELFRPIVHLPHPDTFLIEFLPASGADDGA